MTAPAPEPEATELDETSPWWAAHLPAEYIDNATGKRYRVTGVTTEEIAVEEPAPESTAPTA